jgi:type I restriction enzyme S subunit
MGSNYKKLGPYIQIVNERNSSLSGHKLLGVSIKKCFIPSIANIIGTDMSTYKLIRKKQFAYGPVTSRNGDKISIALLEDFDEAMVSQAYTVFEIKDFNELDPEYLMMWFRRAEFDRYARFKSHGSAREIFDWAEMNETELPIPSIEKQREIVREYNTIVNRISMNEQLIQKLEDTARAIYKQWFVDFEFPDENGKPYKSSSGKMIWSEELEKEIPEGWYQEQLINFVDSNTTISYGVVTPEESNEDGIKFIRSCDINDGTILEKNLNKISQKVSNKYSKTIVEGGELLLSIVGTPGAVAIVPDSLAGSNISRSIASFKISDRKRLLYLLGFFNSKIGQEKIMEISGGSVQSVVNLADLRELKINIPEEFVFDKYYYIHERILKRKNQLLRMQGLLNNLKVNLLSKMTKVKESAEKGMI